MPCIIVLNKCAEENLNFASIVTFENSMHVEHICNELSVV